MVRGKTVLFIRRKLLFIFFLLIFSNFSRAQLANHVVIAEVYGGGGNSRSYWEYDYIILYNPTSNTIDLSNWSVQYASATGTNWQVTNLTSSIPPNAYYSIQQGQGSGGIAALPFIPNVMGTTSMSATSGKVALVSDQTALSGANPLSDANIIDFIGYGIANAYEGSGSAPTLSNTSSARRKDNNGNNTYDTNGSGWDVGDNSSDFYEETDIVTYPPLPVELTSFSASVIDEGIKLNWQTETEVNNYGFDVERKVGIQQIANDNWESIGFVNGNGNSNSPKEYSFIDKDIKAGKYYYRLKQIDNDGTFTNSKVIDIEANKLLGYELKQNYPNPFNPVTTIKFTIPEADKIAVKVFNILGEKVAEIVNQWLETGIHEVNFDASDLNSGIYLYRIEAGNFVTVKKMTLLK